MSHENIRTTFDGWVESGRADGLEQGHGDVVRQVQIARREADFDVSDRITLFVAGTEAVLEAVRAHESYLKEQVLATAVELASPSPEAFVSNAELDGAELVLGVVRGT